MILEDILENTVRQNFQYLDEKLIWKTFCIKQGSPCSNQRPPKSQQQAWTKEGLI